MDLLAFFRTGPDRPPVSRDPGEIRRLYKRSRWSVFLSVTLGYGMFYVARMNLSVAKVPLLEEGVFSNTQLGIMGSALLGVYAVGKTLNGFLADRAHIARFLSTALLLSAGVNLLLGLTTSFWVFVALWGLNGWFQSIGSAPCVVTLSQWFSRKEIGTRYGIWSTSHGIGNAITKYLTAVLVAHLGWRWGFWGPGLACGLAALVLYHTLRDRPQACGLPPVSEYRNDPEPPAPARGPLGRAQLRLLLHPGIWLLGMSSAAMYVVRYGLDSWGVLLLRSRGCSLVDAALASSLYSLATVAGALLSGVLSDRLFHADRRIPAALFGVLNIAGLVALRLAPPGSFGLDVGILLVQGLAIGVLVTYLGGLMAVDICPREVTGAAMGLIGGLSYVGAAIQDTVSGVLLDASAAETEGVITYSFETTFRFWIAMAVLSLLLTLAAWNAGRRAR
ncbi:MAG: MFS transporter [Deltaproteobacteria bacterium]|nr:MFS transporter [Deltaproteobacteria bacterium]